jgi:hypothetical protein
MGKVWQRTLRELVISSVVLIGSLSVASAEVPGSPVPIEVKSYTDTQSAGWAYKKNDTAFVVESGGCRIQWNVVEPKEAGARKQIGVRRDCGLPFSDQLPFHRAILREIFSKWPVDDFDSLSWGSFGSAADWSWNMPIAVASFRSPEYADYKARYPQSRITNINAIFVMLADRSGAYGDLRKLMVEFGADVELASVEKVFVGEAKKLSFHAALKRDGIPGNARVIYDVAFSYFRIKKVR